jgi:hypothetical protein
MRTSGGGPPAAATAVGDARIDNPPPDLVRKQASSTFRMQRSGRRRGSMPIAGSQEPEPHDLEKRRRRGRQREQGLELDDSFVG